MAHLILEYSDNLDGDIDIDALFDKLHTALIDTGIFPVGGLRSRAYACHEYRIADGDADLAFVNLSMKIGHGRSAQDKERVAKLAFDTMKAHLKPLFGARYMAISFEMTELHATYKYNLNNIHKKFQ